MHSIKKAGLLDFRQDGRLGLVSLHIINVFLVGFCRRERERVRERHGVGSEEDCVLVEQSTFPFIPQDQF